MAAKRAVACIAWALLPAYVDGASTGSVRDRTCLTGVTAPLYEASQRSNITVNGVAGPLKLGAGDWQSSTLLGWIAKVLIEDVLGVNVDFRLWMSSFDLLHAVSGCKDPTNRGDEKCDAPGPTQLHVALEVWQTASLDAALEGLKSKLPAQFPISLGSVGYPGQSVFFVKESSARPAMEQAHLPLQYYLSYSHPQVDVSSYFDSMFNISSGELRPCNATQMMNGAIDVSKYLAFSGDTAGVSDGGTKLRCTNDHWWIAPACRADLTKCIPFLTGGDGWDVEIAVHRASKWGMGLAVAVTKDWATHGLLPKLHRTMAGWWYPDNSFLDVSPKLIAFPKYDPVAQAEGKLYNSNPEIPLISYGFSGMTNRSNDGNTRRILDLVTNMKVSEREIVELMQLALTKPAGAVGMEQTVCEWLNANTARWEAWIPVETSCLEGQGLTSEHGEFVPNRTMARRCSWCTPGRVSSALQDADGLTHTCVECGQGEYQSAIGMTECDRCDPGTAAPRRGMANCARCGISEYVAVAGATQCQSCPAGFVTPYEGARSKDACMCPEGTYRDGTRRDSCLGCKFGMECPAGSDALGLLPAQAARYPTAPLLRPGFWSSSTEPLSVFRCEDEVRCPGLRAPGSACFDRLEGQACQHCTEGFVWDGAVCRQCSDQAIMYILFPVFPAVAVPVVIVGLYKMTGDEYSLWGKWQNGVTAVLALLLHYYHLMRVIHRTDVAYTPAVDSALGTFAWTSDLWSVFEVGCYGFQSFSKQLILQSLGPVILVFAYVATWSASQLVARRFPMARMEINRTISGLLSIILIFFTSIADTALTIFKCVRNPNGKDTLAFDRSILCFEGEWKALSVVGILSALIWCAGTMVVFMYAIWTAPRQFHRKGVQSRWKFLFIRYRDDVHWWALTIMTKSIAVNMGSIIMTTGIGQVAWILLVLLIYTHFVSSWRPYRSAWVNTWDHDLHLTLVVACAAMFWFAKDPSIASTSTGDIWNENLVKVASYAPPAACVPIIAGIYLWQRSKLAVAQKERDMVLLVNSIRLLASKSNPDLKKFLSALSENDWLTMVKAKDIVELEVAARKSRRGLTTRQVSLQSIDSIVKGLEEQEEKQEQVSLGHSTASVELNSVRDQDQAKLSSIGDRGFCSEVSAEENGPAADDDDPTFMI